MVSDQAHGGAGNQDGEQCLHPGARTAAAAVRAGTAAARKHSSYPEYRPTRGAGIEPDGLT